MGGVLIGKDFRILNRRDCPLDRSLVSDDLSPDEISATGGHRCFAPVDECIIQSFLKMNFKEKFFLIFFFFLRPV